MGNKHFGDVVMASLRYFNALEEVNAARLELEGLIQKKDTPKVIDTIKTFTTGQYAKKHGVKYQTAYARIQAAIKKGTIKKVVRGQFVKVKKA